MPVHEVLCDTMIYMTPKNKGGRPRKADIEKRKSLRHCATIEEHAFIRAWLKAGGLKFEKGDK
jgi:hypothetical protein